jgi:phosphopantetheinyl transferase
VEAIVDRPEGFEAAAFTPAERSLLDRWTGADRAEWITRFWCAKEAAAKAIGVGLADGLSVAEVIRLDAATGVVHVRLAAGHTNDPLRVLTARRAEHAWAWTLEEGTEP